MIIKFDEKNIQPIYLLLGSESYLREQWTKDLIKKLIDPAMQDMNLARYHPKLSEMDFAKFVGELRSYPCFSNYRVGIIENIEQLNKKAQEALSAYLQAAAASTVLVLQAEKLDQRLSLTKLINKHATLIHCDPLETTAASKWLMEAFAAQGKNIDAKLAQYIVIELGCAMWALQTIVDQLSIYVGAGEPNISAHAVQELLFSIKEENLFECVDSIASLSKKAKLKDNLRSLIQSGEPVPKILSLVIRHFNILLSIKEGIDTQQLMQLFPMPRPALQRYQQQCKLLAARLSRETIHKLYYLDKKIKSSGDMERSFMTGVLQLL